MARSEAGHLALRDELRDLLTLETRLHARVGAELSAGEGRGGDKARELLQRLEPRAYAHRVALEEALHRMHERVPLLRRAVAAAHARAARWLPRERSRVESTGELRDVYALLAGVAAAYLVLASSAHALGDTQTSTLAERSADDVNEFLEEIALLLFDLARADVGTPIAPVAGQETREGRSR